MADFVRLCREDDSQLLAWGSNDGWAAPWDLGKATGNLLCVVFQPSRGQKLTHEPPVAAEMAKDRASAFPEPTELLLLPGPSLLEMLEMPPDQVQGDNGPRACSSVFLGLYSATPGLG